MYECDRPVYLDTCKNTPLPKGAFVCGVSLRVREVPDKDNGIIILVIVRNCF
jgi:hypothetical protein